MTSWIESLFPKLEIAAYRITSPATRDYNCIAWAANDIEHDLHDLTGEYYGTVAQFLKRPMA